MAVLDIFNDVTLGEFATVDAGTIGRFIGYAAQDINPTMWGTKSDRATALLAAHMLAVAKRGSTGPAGPVTMERVGEMAYQYDRIKVSERDAEYATTGYGQEFLRLRRMLPTGPVSI